MNRRKGIIKIGAKIKSKKIQKFNETKIWFFENMNKINKHLTILTKKKREELSKQNQKLKRRINN